MQACILSFYYAPDTMHKTSDDDENPIVNTSISGNEGGDIASLSAYRYLEVAERCLPVLLLLGQQQHPSSTAATGTSTTAGAAAGGDVLSRLVSGLLVMLYALTTPVSVPTQAQKGNNGINASRAKAVRSESRMRFLEAYINLVISAATASANRRKVH
jgi:hypothetical protein